MEDREKNKPKQAIALEYDPEDIAPRVIATGSGHLADKIIDSAKKAEIPVHADE